MGLGNNTGRFTYANIKRGKVAVKKDGVIGLYSYIEGQITGLELRDEEYNGDKYKKLCVMINDKDEDFQLQMRLDSGYGRAFCNIILNADLTKRLKISPTFEEINGKPKSGMFINQGGSALKWFFTKDNPHDLPPMEKVVFKGKEEWDNSKQQAFYIDLLLNKIQPKLTGSIIDGPANELDRVPSAAEITEPIDDLPF